MKQLDMYDDQFYQNQIDGSYRSAKIYVDILSGIYKIDSVVDVGCGRGAWLKAFKESGTNRLVGFDGPWNSQSNMIEDSINFHPCNLNDYIKIDGNDKFDLAMSLEVAEHIEPSSASIFIDSLTNMSDVIMFGAAIIGQGGTNHINEQPQTFWANLFNSKNYVVFDVFRPVVWGMAEVDYWYQQNTFLYVRKDSQVYKELISKNISPISNIRFMDCIHPVQFRITSNRTVYFFESLGLLIKAFKNAIKLRFSRLQK